MLEFIKFHPGISLVISIFLIHITAVVFYCLGALMTRNKFLDGVMDYE